MMVFKMYAGRDSLVLSVAFSILIQRKKKKTTNLMGRLVTQFAGSLLT